MDSSDNDSVNIPLEADQLIVHSTPEGMTDDTLSLGLHICCSLCSISEL